LLLMENGSDKLHRGHSIVRRAGPALIRFVPSAPAGVFGLMREQRDELH
jgi:hypothetical protein